MNSWLQIFGLVILIICFMNVVFMVYSEDSNRIIKFNILTLIIIIIYLCILLL